LIIGRFNPVKIPLARVERIERRGRGNEQVCTVFTVDGEHYEFAERDIDTGLQATIQATIPGNGAKLVEHWRDEDDSIHFDLTEILCFTIDAVGGTHAITISDTFDEPTVLFPDGHVEAYQERWDSFDDFRREKMTKNDLPE
jgi:hypothetical protein